ncbi:hypothetical protein [Halobacteriovorax sp. HLS]|uniref:hypothetical protein n=1 Tax=Halobacteriovorax sp. HLS TaxID=2234000 RepID=UPI0013E3FE17|nr:hypothetical protein [Halobacteriovorax sp. HLS]
MRKKNSKELVRCKKSKLTSRQRKARNHLKLFTLKKNTPEWEILLEEYRLRKSAA